MRINCIVSFVWLFFSTIFINGAFLQISIPKCGTNLLSKCLYKITLNKPISNKDNWFVLDQLQLQSLIDSFVFCHAPAWKENTEIIMQTNLPVIFIYRDPRDQIISLAHYIFHFPSLWPELTKLSKKEVVTTLISHSLINRKEVGTIKEMYEYYLPWISCPLVYSTTFEKLIGSKGGGSDELQLQEIIAIANHLGIKLSIDEAKEIAKELFGGSGTFREGRIGAWKEEGGFSSEDKELFKKVAGQLLIDLDYEKDLNW